MGNKLLAELLLVLVMGGFDLVAPSVAHSSHFPVFAAPLQSDKKALRVSLEGDASMRGKMIQALRDREDEYGFRFTFTEKATDPYDIRIVTGAEGTGTWNYAQGSAVVLSSDCSVITVVMRSNRLTAKGAVNAVAKEVVKDLQQFYGTKKKD